MVVKKKDYHRFSIVEILIVRSVKRNSYISIRDSPLLGDPFTDNERTIESYDR